MDGKSVKRKGIGFAAAGSAVSIINERAREADRPPALNQYDGLSRGDDRSLIFSLADSGREYPLFAPSMPHTRGCHQLISVE